MTAYCADTLARASIPSVLGQVKVDETTLAIDSDHYVPGTDVSMDDPPIVQILYCWREFSGGGMDEGRRIVPMMISWMILVRCLESLNAFSGT